MITFMSDAKKPPGFPWVLFRLSSTNKVDLWSAEKCDGYTIADLTNSGARIMARDLAPKLVEWLVENGFAQWLPESKGDSNGR